MRISLHERSEPLASISFRTYTRCFYVILTLCHYETTVLRYEEQRTWQIGLSSHTGDPDSVGHSRCPDRRPCSGRRLGAGGSDRLPLCQAHAWPAPRAVLGRIAAAANYGGHDCPE